MRCFPKELCQTEDIFYHDREDSTETVFTNSEPKKTLIVDKETEINVLAYFELFNENSIRVHYRH